MRASGSDIGAGAQAGEGTDARAGADARIGDMAVGEDLGPTLHDHAGAEEHVWLDQGVLADDRIMAEPNRFRSDKRCAALHRLPAGPILKSGLGRRELHARVHPLGFLLRAQDGPCDKTISATERDGIC